MKIFRFLNLGGKKAGDLEEFVPEVDPLEMEITMATLKIASEQPMGIAEFSFLKKFLPYHVRLPGDDGKGPAKDPGEEYWEEQFRKIESNFGKRGNLLTEGHVIRIPDIGFRITPKGREYLKSKGFVPLIEW